MASLLLAFCSLAFFQTSAFDSNQSESTISPLKKHRPTYYNATYSEENATRCLYLAYGAYCNQSSLASWTCKWCEYIPGFQMLNITQTDHLQAFVGFDVEYDQIVISFRGTHNAADWLDDLDLIQIAYPGVKNGYIHKGFYESWIKELKPSIMNAAITLMDKYPNKAILITGHSLGAAVAQVAAIDVANYAKSHANDALIYIYDYGSPRWGNMVMVNYFEELIGYHFRLVNQKDPIPKLPYQHMGEYDEYHHSWTQIWYTNDSTLEYIQCDGSGEDKECRYLGVHAEDHLHYLNIYESCEPNDVNEPMHFNDTYIEYD